LVVNNDGLGGLFDDCIDLPSYCCYLDPAVFPDHYSTPNDLLLFDSLRNPPSEPLFPLNNDSDFLHQQKESFGLPPFTPWSPHLLEVRNVQDFRVNRPLCQITNDTTSSVKGHDLSTIWLITNYGNATSFGLGPSPWDSDGHPLNDTFSACPSSAWNPSANAAPSFYMPDPENQIRYEGHGHQNPANTSLTLSNRIATPLTLMSSDEGLHTGAVSLKLKPQLVCEWGQCHLRFRDLLIFR